MAQESSLSRSCWSKDYYVIMLFYKDIGLGGLTIFSLITDLLLAKITYV